jgi:hypothetical protein
MALERLTFDCKPYHVYVIQPRGLVGGSSSIKDITDNVEIKPLPRIAATTSPTTEAAALSGQ